MTISTTIQLVILNQLPAGKHFIKMPISGVGRKS